MYALAERVQAVLGASLDFVNFGSGLGISYASTDVGLDTAALGRAFSRLLADFRGRGGKARILMETGRYLLGNSGVYAMKVLDKKVSGSKTFIILKNTLNGFLRPTLAQLMGSDQAAEPLFTERNAFQFTVIPSDEAGEELVKQEKERVTRAATARLCLRRAFPLRNGLWSCF